MQDTPSKDTAGASGASGSTPPPSGETKTDTKTPTSGQTSGGPSKSPARNVQKTMGNTSAATTRTNVPDVKFVGDGDTWKLVSKASSESEGWMKSTKAMNVPSGVVIQVTTQQRSGGGYAIAEALTFVPGVKVVNTTDGNVALAPL